MTELHYIEDDSSVEGDTNNNNDPSVREENRGLPQADNPSGLNLHRDKMEKFLSYGSEYARDGDRSMMDFSLSEAAYHAQHAGALDSVFQSRVSAIQARMGSERLYHLRMLKKCLSLSVKYAVEGDQTMLVYTIADATEHASSAGVLNATFLRRIEALQAHLGSDRSFHVRGMFKLLDYATECAREGDKNRATNAIQNAQIHANNAGVSTEVFRQHVEQVQRQMGNAKAFHLQKMKRQLRYATESMCDRDKSMMKFFLLKACQHARRAGVPMHTLKRQFAIMVAKTKVQRRTRGVANSNHTEEQQQSQSTSKTSGNTPTVFDLT